MAAISRPHRPFRAPPAAGFPRRAGGPDRCRRRPAPAGCRFRAGALVVHKPQVRQVRGGDQHEQHHDPKNDGIGAKLGRQSGFCEGSRDAFRPGAGSRPSRSRSRRMASSSARACSIVTFGRKPPDHLVVGETNVVGLAMARLPKKACDGTNRSTAMPRWVPVKPGRQHAHDRQARRSRPGALARPLRFFLQRLLRSGPRARPPRPRLCRRGKHLRRRPLLPVRRSSCRRPPAVMGKSSRSGSRTRGSPAVFRHESAEKAGAGGQRLVFGPAQDIRPLLAGGHGNACQLLRFAHRQVAQGIGVQNAESGRAEPYGKSQRSNGEKRDPAIPVQRPEGSAEVPRDGGHTITLTCFRA